MRKLNKMVEQNSFKTKISISIDDAFHELLKQKARQDYVKVAMWIQQFLMRNLLDKNNDVEFKSLTKNGKEMDLNQGWQRMVLCRTFFPYADASNEIPSGGK